MERYDIYLHFKLQSSANHPCIEDKKAGLFFQAQPILSLMMPAPGCDKRIFRLEKQLRDGNVISSLRNSIRNITKTEYGHANTLHNRNAIESIVSVRAIFHKESGSRSSS